MQVLEKYDKAIKSCGERVRDSKDFSCKFFLKTLTILKCHGQLLKTQYVYEFAEENVFGADCDEIFVHRSTSMNINDL